MFVATDLVLRTCVHHAYNVMFKGIVNSTAILIAIGAIADNEPPQMPGEICVWQ